MRVMLLAAVSAILLANSGTTADKPKKDEPKRLPLMAEKLKYSQSLLEGLATNDFAKIEKSAEELMRISKAAEWTVFKTPAYELQTNNFRRSIEDVIKKAKAKNLDGATLSYVDMTVTCVRCHQHCREVRNTSLVPALGHE